MTRRDALAQLLAQSDPIDLPPRRYAYVLPRDQRRDPETIKRDLTRAYTEWLKHGWCDESSVVSVRRSRLHLVKTRTA